MRRARTGLLEVLGERNDFHTLDEAVEALTDGRASVRGTLVLPGDT